MEWLFTDVTENLSLYIFDKRNKQTPTHDIILIILKTLIVVSIQPTNPFDQRWVCRYIYDIVEWKL